MNAIDPDIAAFGPEEQYQQPPHNEEAEQALLGALLVNNEVMQKAEGLKPEHFYIPVHARIFEAAERTIDRGQIANPVTLKTFFEKDEALSEVGGSGYLARLASMAATVINAGSYAEAIRSLWERRQAIIIAEDLIDDAHASDPDVTSAMVIEKAEQALYGLAEMGRGLSSGPRTVRDVTLSALEQAEKAYQRPGGVVGIATGIKGIDAILGGLQRSDLVILAARPAMGKSALAANIAFHAATRAEEPDGAPAGFWSLEMASEQLALRIMGELSGIPSDFIRRGEIDGGQFGRVVLASQTLAKAALYIDDTPALTIAQLRARARRMKRQHGIGLIVVDYLQLLRPSFRSTGDSRVQEVSEITQGLKALAKELDVPVLALAQLSRAVEQREDKRPLLSDLRESGSIEQDADVVIFLYREEYYLAGRQPAEPGSEAYMKWEQRMEAVKGKAEAIVAKHRHGRIDTAHMAFHGPTTKFSDLEA